MPRDDDDAPFEMLRREIARLEPQKVYLPLGVGGHVDHQLCREVGIRLLAGGPSLGDARARTTPGIVTFYEDFPYAWWNDFKRPRRPGRRPARGPARPTSASRPSTPTSPTSSSARSWASTCTRARSSGCSTAPGDGRRGPRRTAGDRRSSASVDGHGRAVLGLGPRLTRWARRDARNAGPDRYVVALAWSSSRRRSSSASSCSRPRASRRHRPVRPVGPRHRRRRPGQRLRPEPLVPAGRWPTSGGCWRRSSRRSRPSRTRSDPGIRGADEGARLAGRPRDRGAAGLCVPCATAAGRVIAAAIVAAPPGRLRHQRLVGPVREHLPAVRAGRGRLRA